MATVVSERVVEQVFAWRMQTFMDLGFNATEAEALALSNVDLGDARRLRDQGCSLDLIVKILA